MRMASAVRVSASENSPSSAWHHARKFNDDTDLKRLAPKRSRSSFPSRTLTFSANSATARRYSKAEVVAGRGKCESPLTQRECTQRLIGDPMVQGQAGPSRSEAPFIGQ